MNEIPSSAVTAAHAVVASPSGDGLDVVAASAMVSPDGAADPVAALALDDIPLDLLLRVRGLVEIAPRGDAPLYASDGVGDWSGATHDSARLAGLSPPGFDMVFDGAGAGDHMAADHPAFFAAADVVIPAAMIDPVVDLGALSGAPDSFAPTVHDAPVHVDVAIDDAARIGLDAPDVRAPELSWLAGLDGVGLHVGEAWAWNDVKGGYVFDHYV